MKRTAEATRNSSASSGGLGLPMRRPRMVFAARGSSTPGLPVVRDTRTKRDPEEERNKRPRTAASSAPETDGNGVEGEGEAGEAMSASAATATEKPKKEPNPGTPTWARAKSRARERARAHAERRRSDFCSDTISRGPRSRRTNRRACEEKARNSGRVLEFELRVDAEHLGLAPGGWLADPGPQATISREKDAPVAEGASGPRRPFAVSIGMLTADLLGRMAKVVVRTHELYERFSTRPKEGGLLDPRMGASLDKRCGTCGALENCYGHPGVIYLEEPCYDPDRLKTVLKICNSYCVYCAERLYDPPSEHDRRYAGHAALIARAKHRSRSARCPHCPYPRPIFKKGDGAQIFVTFGKIQRSERNRLRFSSVPPGGFADQDTGARGATAMEEEDDGIAPKPDLGIDERAGNEDDDDADDDEGEEEEEDADPEEDEGDGGIGATRREKELELFLGDLTLDDVREAESRMETNDEEDDDAEDAEDAEEEEEEEEREEEDDDEEEEDMEEDDEEEEAREDAKEGAEDEENERTAAAPELRDANVYSSLSILFSSEEADPSTPSSRKRARLSANASRGAGRGRGGRKAEATRGVDGTDPIPKGRTPRAIAAEARRREKEREKEEKERRRREAYVPSPLGWSEDRLRKRERMRRRMAALFDSKASDKDRWTAAEVSAFLERVDPGDYEMLGLRELKPGELNQLLLHAIPVAPNTARHSSMVRGERVEHAQTHMLRAVVQFNGILARATAAIRAGVNAAKNAAKADEMRNKIQQQINIMLNPRSCSGPGSRFSGLSRGASKAEVQSGKEGIYRNDLNGYRVGHCARCPITPLIGRGVNVALVPQRVARTVTFPEVVTDLNRRELKRRVAFSTLMREFEEEVWNNSDARHRCFVDAPQKYKADCFSAWLRALAARLLEERPGLERERGHRDRWRLKFAREFLARPLVERRNFAQGANKVEDPVTGDVYDLGLSSDLRPSRLRVGWVVHRHMKTGDPLIVNRQPSLHRLSTNVMLAEINPDPDVLSLQIEPGVLRQYNGDYDGDELNMHLPQTQAARAEVLSLMLIGGDANTASPGSGNVLLSYTQDPVLGMWKLTQPGTLLDEREMRHMVAVSRVSDPTAFTAEELVRMVRPEELPPPATLARALETDPATGKRAPTGPFVPRWTGKQLFRFLVPPRHRGRLFAVEGGDLMPAGVPSERHGREGFFFERRDPHGEDATVLTHLFVESMFLEGRVVPPEEADRVVREREERARACAEAGSDPLEDQETVIVRGDDLLCGVVDARLMGPGPGSLQSAMHAFYEPTEVISFMNRLFRVANRFVTARGHSMGAADFCLSRSRELYKFHMLRKGIARMRDLALSPAYAERGPEAVEHMIHERTKVLGAQTEMSSHADALRHPVRIMTASGAKRGTLCSERDCVGQRYVKGGRIQPRHGSDRVHPYDPRGGRDLVHLVPNGFIAHSFFQGMSPVEVISDAMCARKSFVNSAVVTGDAGYIYRGLNKCMEGLSTHGDLSVRDTGGCIFQFAYGGDGFRPECLFRVDLEFFRMPWETLRASLLPKRYHASPSLSPSHSSSSTTTTTTTTPDPERVAHEAELRLASSLRERYAPRAYSRVYETGVRVPFQVRGMLRFVARARWPLSDPASVEARLAEARSRLASISGPADESALESLMSEARALALAKNNPRARPKDRVDAVLERAKGLARPGGAKAVARVHALLLSVLHPPLDRPDEAASAAFAWARASACFAHLKRRFPEGLPHVVGHLLEHASIRRLTEAHRLTRYQVVLFYASVAFRCDYARVPPGESVGTVAAQSIGEFSAQQTLKDFHFAGAAHNITQGIPKGKEVMRNKNISTPITAFYLEGLHRLETLQAELKRTSLSEIARDVSIRRFEAMTPLRTGTGRYRLVPGGTPSAAGRPASTRSPETAEAQEAIPAETATGTTTVARKKRPRAPSANARPRVARTPKPAKAPARAPKAPAWASVTESTEEPVLAASREAFEDLAYDPDVLRSGEELEDLFGRYTGLSVQVRLDARLAFAMGCTPDVVGHVVERFLDPRTVSHNLTRTLYRMEHGKRGKKLKKVNKPVMAPLVDREFDLWVASLPSPEHVRGAGFALLYVHILRRREDAPVSGASHEPSSKEEKRAARAREKALWSLASALRDVLTSPRVIVSEFCGFGDVIEAVPCDADRRPLRGVDASGSASVRWTRVVVQGGELPEVLSLRGVDRDRVFSSDYNAVLEYYGKENARRVRFDEFGGAFDIQVVDPRHLLLMMDYMYNLPTVTLFVCAAMARVCPSIFQICSFESSYPKMKEAACDGVIDLLMGPSESHIFGVLPPLGSASPHFSVDAAAAVVALGSASASTSAGRSPAPTPRSLGPMSSLGRGTTRPGDALASFASKIDRLFASASAPENSIASAVASNARGSSIRSSRDGSPSPSFSRLPRPFPSASPAPDPFASSGFPPFTAHNGLSRYRRPAPKASPSTGRAFPSSVLRDGAATPRRGSGADAWRRSHDELRISRPGAIPSASTPVRSPSFPVDAHPSSDPIPRRETAAFRPTGANAVPLSCPTVPAPPKIGGPSRSGVGLSLFDAEGCVDMNVVRRLLSATSGHAPDTPYDPSNPGL